MPNLNNLHQFDLNVLPLFFSVYKHSSITKAAAEMQMTPPNITQSINKLRAHFNDPLFVRCGQGIKSTIFCDQLHASLSASFNNIYQSIFNVDTRDEVVIYAPDGPMLDFINKYSKLENPEELPKVIHHTAILEANETIDLFAFRKADIVLTHEKIVHPGIISVKLYTMASYIVVNNNHSEKDLLLEKDNEKKLLDQCWVTLNSGNIHYQSIRKNSHLSRILKKRKVVFESSSQNINLLFIEKTNSVGFISALMYENMSKRRRENITLIPDHHLTMDMYLNYKPCDKNVLKIVEIFLSSQSLTETGDASSE